MKRGKLPDWLGKTVACLASGPSLTAEDCAAVRGMGSACVVTNSTFRLAPWADALYAFDPLWLRLNLAEVGTTFAGRVYSQTLSSFRGVTCLRAWPRFRSFGNSGANAISMAVLCGAARVVLIGYDCQATGGRLHHHADHPAPLRNCDTLPRWQYQFERCASYAADRGVTVINASRATALTVFERRPLHEILDGAADVRGADGRDPGVGAVDVA